MTLRNIILAALFLGCSPHPPTPPTTTGTQVTVTNKQATATTVYFSFGADSKVTAADWSSFCTVTSTLNCNFSLPPGAQALPNPQGKYLNVTLAFGAPVGCNATKAELNVNNPSWYDTYDVSLVDGYSNKVEIDYTPPTNKAVTKLGPPNGKTGNEKVDGVFPYGCDICVARQNPPCGISKGTDGCKSGTQYKPDVPCQFQGPVKGGGGTVDVTLLAN